MNEHQQLLWSKIQQFEIDYPDASLSFSDRLARENGWTLEYTLRVFFEYKKFIFLICLNEHPLTPSDAVDQAWHLHLLYTQSYWIDFCGHTLNRHIHHGPTKGGQHERNKYTDYYEKTLSLYTKTFQQPPPADIWPPGHKRFHDIHFRRVNLQQNFIIRKPMFLQPKYK